MLRSRGLSYLVGVLTLWPVLSGFVFTFGFVIVGLASVGNHSPTDLYLSVWPVLLVTFLLNTGLLICYVLDVVRNPEFTYTSDRRTVWVILVAVVGMIGMPAYWWTYLRPGSEPFERRLRGEFPPPQPWGQAGPGWPGAPRGWPPPPRPGGPVGKP